MQPKWNRGMLLLLLENVIQEISMAHPFLTMIRKRGKKRTSNASTSVHTGTLVLLSIYHWWSLINFWTDDERELMGYIANLNKIYSKQDICHGKLFGKTPCIQCFLKNYEPFSATDIWLYIATFLYRHLFTKQCISYNVLWLIYTNNKIFETAL